VLTGVCSTNAETANTYNLDASLDPGFEPPDSFKKEIDFISFPIFSSEIVNLFSYNPKFLSSMASLPLSIR